MRLRHESTPISAPAAVACAATIASTTRRRRRLSGPTTLSMAARSVCLLLLSRYGAFDDGEVAALPPSASSEGGAGGVGRGRALGQAPIGLLGELEPDDGGDPVGACVTQRVAHPSGLARIRRAAGLGDHHGTSRRKLADVADGGGEDVGVGLPAPVTRCAPVVAVDRQPVDLPRAREELLQRRGA